MITDRIQLAGLEAYFKNPAGKLDLAGLSHTIRTKALNKGKQLEFSGIQLIIEHQDLRELLNFQFDGQGKPQPLFKISVMKEMFAGLFADPYSNRVHNIAGFLDFNEGSLTGGKVMEIDGVPTIVSTGGSDCTWTSREYKLPDPITINAMAWELATSKLTPADSFHYSIQLSVKVSGSNNFMDVLIDNNDQMLKADAKRAKENLDLKQVESFRVTFKAKVFEDSYLTERHLPANNKNIGRPLLRAINLLESVQSDYEFFSLSELLNHCSDYRLFETPGPEIKLLIANLDLSAVLVHSANEDSANDKYEYIELKLSPNQFTRFEAKKKAFIVQKNNR